MTQGAEYAEVLLGYPGKHVGRDFLTPVTSSLVQAPVNVTETNGVFSGTLNLERSARLALLDGDCPIFGSVCLLEGYQRQLGSSKAGCRSRSSRRSLVTRSSGCVGDG